MIYLILDFIDTELLFSHDCVCHLIRCQKRVLTLYILIGIFDDGIRPWPGFLLLLLLFLLELTFFRLEPGWEMKELSYQGGLKEGLLESCTETQTSQHQRGLDTTNLSEYINHREELSLIYSWLPTRLHLYHHYLIFIILGMRYILLYLAYLIEP